YALEPDIILRERRGRRARANRVVQLRELELVLKAAASAPKYASITCAFCEIAAGSPSVIFLPKLKTQIRSQMLITAGMLCSTKMLVMPGRKITLRRCHYRRTAGDSRRRQARRADRATSA